MGRRRTDKSLVEYKPTADSPAQRVADFLFWASKEYPTRSIAIELIVKHAYVMSTTPRAGNKQIEVFRKSNVMQRAKAILRDQHGCECDYTRGVGYRATVDSNDIIDVVIEKKARRARSAHKGLETSLNLIKTSEVTGKARKDRLAELIDVNKRLAAASINGKLLPEDTRNKK